MKTQLPARTERALQIAIDIGERIFVILLFASFAVRMWHSFAPEPYNLLAVMSEGLVVVFMLIRRNPSIVTMRPVDWLIAFVGTSAPMIVSAGGHSLFPPIVGTVFMFAGLILAIVAKLTLRRSFGIAAANRSVVSAGPYRFVRHPMYAGYTLVYVGFLLNNPLVWNLEIYSATIALFVARIFAEETVLAADPGYASFMHKVRYRLIPGLF